ncbi:MAG: DegT/DnrJ/EryC1/StrS family aminotransferase, partial [Planctomycetota bacterium]
DAWGGLSRDRFLEALEAEGVPATGGYSFTNFENPVFDNIDLSSPQSVFMIGRSQPIDYRSFADKCPNAVRACRQEAVWLMHNLFLGNTSHVDMILEAILKIRKHSQELC